MQEVARRARLSPATVLNHFPDPLDLAASVLERIEADLKMPADALFEEVTDIGSRMRLLSVALAEFYERSEPWYKIHVAERASVPALVAAEARFYRRLHALTRRALGPLGRRPRIVSAVMAVTSPPVFGQLRAQGLTAADAGKTVGDMLAPWLTQLASARRASR